MDALWVCFAPSANIVNAASEGDAHAAAIELPRDLRLSGNRRSWSA